MSPAHLAGLLLAGVTVVAVSLLAPRVWLVLPVIGLLVVAFVVGAAGWGAWPAAWLRTGKRSRGQTFCLATALGLGLLSTLTLALGAAGWLSGSVAWILLAVGGALGLLRLWRQRPVRQTVNGPGWPWPDALLKGLLLLPLCVPLAVALFGSSLPPGILWNAEARGYDVLEYHLQVPREYYDAGRIHFLPHNVYASFPQGVELLYLLLMYLGGGPLAAALPAQLLHLVLGVLAVAALAAWATPGWSRILVVLVAGTVPWLAYLGCLAYVELGMLFFAAVAGGLVAESLRGSQPPSWRTALAAGLCAGLAGGCKYTALALVALALGIAWLVIMRGGLSVRLRRLLLFGAGALVASSPWLVRNAGFTGNPVYPFAYGWFGGRAWSAEQDAQWAQGHRLPAEKDSLAGRARIAADELFGGGMYGLAIWVLPLLAIALRPSRRHWLAVVWAVLIVGVWAVGTHMPGRFAVAVVVPLGLILGGGGAQRTHRAGGIGLVVLLLAAVAGALQNDAKLLGLVRAEASRWERLTDVPLAQMVDRTDVRVQAEPINQAVTQPEAYVWLVGDARGFYARPRTHCTVVFARDPWLEYAAGGADARQCVVWLRTQKVTHVVFSWAEIERLRGSYGFPPMVTRAWVRELAAAGLRRLTPGGEVSPEAAVEIYEVLPE